LAGCYRSDPSRPRPGAAGNPGRRAGAGPRPLRSIGIAQAAELYTGDLLSGFALDEAPFEEWLLAERERLRELALEALARLLAHQRKAGALEAGVHTAVKLLGLDPLQEPVHRMLMRLYADLGRRGAALRQYQQCVAVLQRDLRIEPEAETALLYEEIFRRRPEPLVVDEPPVEQESPHGAESRVPGAGGQSQPADARLRIISMTKAVGRAYSKRSASSWRTTMESVTNRGSATS
jgi:DNA-binding SARP family transcriptional activator